MPGGSKAEAFIDRVRVPGGDRSDCPSLDGTGLTDTVSLEPLFVHVRRWIRWRDGCAAQYQGKSAFLAWQSMQARLGEMHIDPADVEEHSVEAAQAHRTHTEYEDCRNRAHHGKCKADGATHTARSNIKGSCHDEYDAGSRALARHLANKYPRPNRGQQIGSAGLYSPTKYVYMYVPQEEIDAYESVVAADEGYEGSSKDHYYVSKGATMESARLFRRARVCGCSPCLRLDQEHCKLAGDSLREAATTPRGHSVHIPPMRQAPEVAQTRRNRRTLADYSSELTVGQKIILRVHPSDRAANPLEGYFVAQVAGEAMKLDAAETYSGTRYRKNDWIVKIRWYNILRVAANGDRHYERRGEVQHIHCNSIVRNLTRDVSLDWTGSFYKLKEDLHHYIERFGDLNTT